MVRKNYDGDDLVMVTMETQTDFTWLDGASPSAVPEEEPMDDLPQSKPFLLVIVCANCIGGL